MIMTIEVLVALGRPHGLENTSLSCTEISSPWSTLNKLVCARNWILWSKDGNQPLFSDQGVVPTLSNSQTQWTAGRYRLWRYEWDKLSGFVIHVSRILFQQHWISWRIIKNVRTSLQHISNNSRSPLDYTASYSSRWRNVCSISARLFL
jgi:hypothetical protein